MWISTLSADFAVLFERSIVKVLPSLTSRSFTDMTTVSMAASVAIPEGVLNFGSFSLFFIGKLQTMLTGDLLVLPMPIREI
jgi:hypothetical protein